MTEEKRERLEGLLRIARNKAGYCDSPHSVQDAMEAIIYAISAVIHEMAAAAPTGKAEGGE